jgi:hypothetical protein
MKKMIVTLACLAAGLVGTMATPTPAVADGIKCRPDVKATNKKDIAVKVLKFKYKVAGSGDTFTEDLSNKVLKKGESETWKSQTLKFAAKGVVITSTAFEFQNDDGKGWGPAKTSDWTSQSGAFGDSDTYASKID